MSATETPSLADLLLELAELAPDFIRVEPRRPLEPGGREYGPLLFLESPYNARAHYRRAMVSGGYSGALEVEAPELPHVQAALQELCESRGWGWQLRRAQKFSGLPENLMALVELPGDGGVFHGWADTPAHALALAVVRTLRVERGA